ncbi:2OG-Fe(II) oxygenase family protein [Pseudohalocynthiibacter sp. F2068]|jgi:isopenicillin N synthase-like dioxygenase|uniref:isopenicillin N synthase family dioxygenase n=1 Tax=Pseudohalocynthiibacter sp. F2068 TaxID=2926418 RepID=UPI001FF165D0|nr:2OG-Fe(II) oxygenase family protein [Pseudohalocynthiibacter sp. F2068]MCK0101455.1 hypothetical protein [Pseudohalocynthiibacter sp. F2068]
MMIPEIDIASLFDGPSDARDLVDREIFRAAGEIGFMTITGLPDDCLSRDLRKDLLSIFELPDSEKRTLTRKNFVPENMNVYRGWFPLQNGYPTYKEGIDIGADIIDKTRVPDPLDPLTELTPLPDLPTWRVAAEQYYGAMSKTGGALMRSIARALSLPETQFDAAFQNGTSTLRMIHYPPRPSESFGSEDKDFWAEYKGEQRYLLGAAHMDSGFITLLAQDGVEGLQAKTRDGEWIMVPPKEGTLTVNFGKLLQRWTGGAIKATIHRVIGNGQRRYSVPFFFEPSINTVIAPLEGCGEPFAPVLYGDHLWEATTGFVEQKGIAHLRQPKGVGV